MRAEDVGFFDPEFQASEQEHGKTIVVNAGKHAYYFGVLVFVDRLNELNRKTWPHPRERCHPKLPARIGPNMVNHRGG